MRLRGILNGDVCQVLPTKGKEMPTGKITKVARGKCIQGPGDSLSALGQAQRQSYRGGGQGQSSEILTI